MPSISLTKWLLLALLLGLSYTSFSQDTCQITISGRVTDEHSGEVLEYATVLLEGTNKGAVVDSNGNYKLNNICPGRYIITCRHIGCEPIYDTITLTKSVTHNFFPEHHAEELNASTITIYKLTQIESAPIFTRSDLAITDKLKLYPEVTSSQTGARVSKPTVWALWGNRVAIYDNGVPVNDQQWGQDHAPSVSNTINGMKLIQDGEMMEYTSQSSGGVISLQSGINNFSFDTNFHANINRFYATNGKGVGSQIDLNKGFKNGIHSLVNIDFIKAGDLETPDYNLTNTGIAELNVGLHLGYMHSRNSKWNYKLSAKSLNRENGVLAASHIGNITDLNRALNSDTPLIIKDFSYDINNPRQRVSHNTFSTSANYNNYVYNDYIKNIVFIYAYQDNMRQEFDIRRAGREGTPSLDLNLTTHYFSTSFNKIYLKKDTNRFFNHTSKNMGVSFLSEKNINDPNTGIRPLLPNYEGILTGAFIGYTFPTKLGTSSFISRLDYRTYRALKYNFNNQLLEYKDEFILPAVTLSNQAEIFHLFTLKTSLSYSNRAPAVNELLSEGLHHSAASIEEGNTGLTNETSYKFNTSIDGDILKGFMNLYVNIYAHKIDNYIQLQPQQELRQTIQGAFPVYSYSQTNAQFLGVLTKLSKQLSADVDVDVSYRHLNAKDVTNDTYLTFIPGNTLEGSLNYNLNYRSKMRVYKKFPKQIFGSLSTETVFKQNNYPKDGVLAPPPATYSLINASISYPYLLKNKSLATLTIDVDNLTNIEYRNYLDRLRYFAALPGRNITFNLKYTF